MKIRVKSYDIIDDVLNRLIECRPANCILEKLNLLKQLGLLRRGGELNYTVEWA